MREGTWDEILLITRFSISLPSLTRKSVFSFQEYIDAHPETIVLDPLPAIRTLHKALDCLLPSWQGPGRRVKGEALEKEGQTPAPPPAPEAAEWEVTRPPSQS